MPTNIQQIIQVTSETLQAKIRQLLPSQQGFGVDLQASNVIVPVIDLTASAEGSELPQSLQEAAAHGSNTRFSVFNSNSTIANSPGFYKIQGSSSVGLDATTYVANSFRITDGSTEIRMWEHTSAEIGSQIFYTTVDVELYFYLNAGDSLLAYASNNCFLNGSIRQVADVNGNLVNPSGYQPQ